MSEFYIQYEYWFAVTQLVLAMVGMGATLTPSDFKEVLLEPKAVTIGLLAQILMVPLVTWGMIQVLGVVGGVAVGLALIAAIPGGTVSNIFTHFANGNTALSITVTAVTTIACLATTPLILDLLIANYMPADFEMPAGQIAVEIGLCLLLPLVVGMVWLKLFPAIAEGFSKWCIHGSLFVIILIVLGSLSAGRLDLKAFGMSNVLVVLGLLIMLVVINALFTRLLGLKRADVTAIEMEVVVRNINLGLLIKVSLFPSVPGQEDTTGNLVLFTLLLFGALQLISGAALIGWHRVRHAAD